MDTTNIKKRALEYLEKDDLKGALISLGSDLKKSPEIKISRVWDEIFMAGLMIVKSGDAKGVRDLITNLDDIIEIANISQDNRAKEAAEQGDKKGKTLGQIATEHGWDKMPLNQLSMLAEAMGSYCLARILIAEAETVKASEDN
jgi:hypothetical protein